MSPNPGRSPVLDAALAHLAACNPALVIAYGSFAQGRTSASSDVDLVVFAPVEAPVHDGSVVAGHPLDAWIHPVADLNNPAEFLRVSPSLVLHDPQGLAPGFLGSVETLRQDAAGPLSDAERNRFGGWIAKMLVRAADNDVEGNYRYRWLVQDFLELWCRYGARLYEGPKRTLALLADLDPGAHATVADLLAGPKDVPRLAHLYRRLTSPLAVLQGPRVDLVATAPGFPRLYQVHERTTGAPLGHAGWEAPSPEGRARLRLWIDPSRRLRGYGAEAFGLVAERFFAEGGRELAESVPPGELNALLRYGFHVVEDHEGGVEVVFKARAVPRFRQ